LWRHHAHLAHQDKELPRDITAQLEELKQYRAKYGLKALALVLLLVNVLFGSKVYAQTKQIAPPLITNLSKNISNEEIFYVGGKTDFTNSQVVIYLQNLGTGETFSQYTESDNKAEWFYRHTSFLSPGNYLLWVQGKVGEELSPPGPQMTMVVNRTAVSFGGGRLSYETIYLFTIILLLMCIAGLSVLITYHYYHGKKKHKALKKDIDAAAESIRRGFAVLKRDIEAELDVIHRIKLSAVLSAEEKQKESQLMSDLEVIQKRIGQEIWEINKEA
jgi:hypothetical protein